MKMDRKESQRGTESNVQSPKSPSSRHNSTAPHLFNGHNNCEGLIYYLNKCVGSRTFFPYTFRPILHERFVHPALFLLVLIFTAIQYIVGISYLLILLVSMYSKIFHCHFPPFLFTVMFSTMSKKNRVG